MGGPPTGTVTFLFTDIEGSTRLWEAHRDAMTGVLERHDAAMRDAVERHGGFVVKTTGDGVHAAFVGAQHAIGAAVDAQRALRAFDGPEGPLRVRMGIHTGFAEQRDGDYFGTSVNRAARVSAAAHGGQILVSQVTEELVGDDLPSGVGVKDLGVHRLRDLTRPERLYQVTGPELDEQFPPPTSIDEFPGNLPLQLTSFVGREPELAGIASALESHRLVTVTGVGGVGKTRIALQVAAEMVPQFEHGAWFCDLATASDARTMLEVVATTLGVVARPGASIEGGVLDFLRARHALVVFDNCEHLLDPISRFAEAILVRCPEVRLLATSREVLGVPGEQVWGLRSLGVADATSGREELTASDACQLFAERARAVRDDFQLDDCLADVADVCRRLDGIPLAIELAAARVAAMSPAEIARLLDERFRLLSGGRRTAVERHQTLRASVEWSYSMLSDTDRLVFERLSAFPSSFDADAARAVGSGGPVEDWDVLDALASLVAKSMLTLDESDPGRTRYRMLETLRQYGREQLDDAGATDDCRRRHAAYFTALSEELGPLLVTADELPARHRILTELDNLRAAVGWGLDSWDQEDAMLAVRLVAALTIMVTVSRSSGIGGWAERAAEHLDGAPVAQRMGVLGGATFGAMHRGDYDAGMLLGEAALTEDQRTDCSYRVVSATALAAILVASDPPRSLEIMQQAREIMREVDDQYGIGTTYAVRAIFLSLLGHVDEAKSEAVEGVRIGREVQNPSLLVLALYAYGMSHVYDDPDAALEALEESRQMTEEGASDIVHDPVRQTLARLRARAGDRDGALAAFAEGLAHVAADGNRPQLTGLLADGIEVLTLTGDDELAAVVAGAVLHGPLQEFLIPIGGDELAAQEAALARLRASLSAADLEAAMQRGASMSFEELTEHVGRAVDDLLRGG